MTKKTIDTADSIAAAMTGMHNPFNQVMVYGGPPPESAPWRTPPTPPYVSPPSLPLDGLPVTFVVPSAKELELMQEIAKLRVDLSRAAREIERLKKAIQVLVEVVE